MVWVQAKMFDVQRHIGEFIAYDAEFYNEANKPVEVFHWVFEALSRKNPMAMTNRATRMLGRAALHGGGSAATGHIPRSEPTAHGPYIPAEQDPLNKLSEEVMAEFSKPGPAAEFVSWLAKTREAQANSKLSGMIFDDIGEMLKEDNVEEYCGLIQKAINERAAARVRASFLLTQQLDGVKQSQGSTQ